MKEFARVVHFDKNVKGSFLSCDSSSSVEKFLGQHSYGFVNLISLSLTLCCDVFY